MYKRKPDLEKLLTLGARDALRQALRQTTPPSLLQLQQLTDHCAGLAPAMRDLRLGVVHSYTSELLDPWLGLTGALEGLKVATYHAPYGLNLEEADANEFVGQSLLRAEGAKTAILVMQQSSAVRRGP